MTDPRKLKFTLGKEMTFYEAARFALVALSALAIVGFVIGFVTLVFRY